MHASQLESLEQRITSLENETALLREHLLQMVERDIRRGASAGRSNKFIANLIGYGVLASTVLCTSSATVSADVDAVPKVFSPSVSLPPLDSFVTWGRHDAVGVPAAHTTEVLSLIGEGSDVNSYLWPLYVELRATTSPHATLPSSQSAGVTVRALVRSTGSPWTAGIHSEIAHGRESLESGTVIATNGTSILLNGEMRSYSSAGETIGVNLQCVFTDKYSKNCDHAINIQAGSPTTTWRDGLHFDSSSGYSSGGIGINFDRARYAVGLDLANNSVRMNANQKIMLEEGGNVYLWYNSSTKKVEIVNGGSVVASF
jgi:hypothetical protein